MIRWATWLFIGLSMVEASGQTMTSLFHSTSQMPHLSLPFEITPSSGVQMVQVQFLDNQAVCKSFLDPYRSHIFHIRCSQAGKLQFKAMFSMNGTLKAISSPTLTINNPTDGTIIDDNGTNDPDILEGQQFFTAYCVECHLPHAKAGRTAPQITNAFNTKNEMKALSSKPSAVQINKISKYLRSLR